MPSVPTFHCLSLRTGNEKMSHSLSLCNAWAQEEWSANLSQIIWAVLVTNFLERKKKKKRIASHCIPPLIYFWTHWFTFEHVHPSAGRSVRFPAEAGNDKTGLRTKWYIQNINDCSVHKSHIKPLHGGGVCKGTLEGWGSLWHWGVTHYLWGTSTESRERAKMAPLGWVGVQERGNALLHQMHFGIPLTLLNCFPPPCWSRYILLFCRISSAISAKMDFCLLQSMGNIPTKRKKNCICCWETLSLSLQRASSSDMRSRKTGFY